MTGESYRPKRVTATWLGQAGFRVESAEGSIVFDPFISHYPGRLVTAPVRPSDLAKADLILVSHEHADHFDLEVLTSMPDSEVTVIVPHPLLAMARDGGIRQALVGARPGEVIAIGDFIVHPVPSFHGVNVSDAYNFGFEISDGEYRYLGYVVDIGGLSIYHSGDTLDHPELAEMLKSLDVDVAFLPINGRDAEREEQNIVGNLSAIEAVELAARAAIRCVVPMHYDMFQNNRGPVGQFVDMARERIPDVHLLIPRVGGPIPLPTRQELLMKGPN